MGKQQGIVFVHLNDVPCREAQTPCHESGGAKSREIHVVRTPAGVWTDVQGCSQEAPFVYLRVFVQVIDGVVKGFQWSFLSV